MTAKNFQVETMAREIVRKHVGFLQVETQQKMIEDIVMAMRQYGAGMVLDVLRDIEGDARHKRDAAKWEKDFKKAALR